MLSRTRTHPGVVVVEHKPPMPMPHDQRGGIPTNTYFIIKCVSANPRRELSPGSECSAWNRVTAVQHEVRFITSDSNEGKSFREKEQRERTLRRMRKTTAVDAAPYPDELMDSTPTSICGHARTPLRSAPHKLESCSFSKQL